VVIRVQSGAGGVFTAGEARKISATCRTAAWICCDSAAVTPAIFASGA
jgi:hypothetical protein